VEKLPQMLMGTMRRGLEDTAQYSDLVTRTNTFILISTSLADPLIMVGLLVFLASFRHLVSVSMILVKREAVTPTYGG
jgi:ABC-type maltose transport system permease subunit